MNISKFLKTFICYLLVAVNAIYALPVEALSQFDLGSPPKEQKSVVKKSTNDKAPTIKSEITSKRESNKKYFRMSDGSTMVSIYSNDVHYLKNGKYEDIDNTIISKSDDEYENTAASYKVKFAKNATTDKLVTIDSNGYTLSWSMNITDKVVASIENPKIKSKNIEDKTILKKTVSNISYKNIMNDTDLKYENTPNSVKESIILNSITAIDNDFSFKLNTGDKLEAALNVDKTINIIDANTKNVIYVIEAPYMYDKSLATSNNINVALDKTEDGYLVRLELDKNWLNDKTRVYPVVIDPTIDTVIDWSAVQDTYIYEGDTDTAIYRANNENLRIGNNNDVNTNGNPTRALLKFDLPVLSSGDQVVEATLSLASSPVSTYPNEEIEFDLHRMSTDWSAISATWSTCGQTANYEYTKITDYTMFNYDEAYPIKGYKFNITRLVKDWYINGKNYGLMIKEHNEQKNYNRSDAYFYSTNALVYDDYYKPVVTIKYRNQTGLEAYQTYQTFSIGRVGTVYTNNYNGNLVLQHQDVTTPGNIMPVSIYHTYNTSDKNINIGYGNGFRLNLNQTLKYDSNDVVYVDEDGTRHYFEYKTDAYYDEDGLDLKLKLENDIFTMTDKSGNKSTFVSSGDTWYLKEITNPNGQKITINLSPLNYNLITSVLDGTSKEILLTYDGGKLSSIKDLQGRYTYYYYTTSGSSYNLTNIKYSDNRNAYYTYDTSNSLIRAKNIDSSWYMFTYSTVSPYKVLSMTQFNNVNTTGKNLKVKYGENITTITDQDNITYNYVFNNYGQTISQYTTPSITGAPKAIYDTYGISYKYVNDSIHSNKLTSVGSAMKPTDNVLANSSGESGSDYWTLVQGGANQGTIGVVDDTSNGGDKSFKISNDTSENIFPYYEQTATVYQMETYTLSAYIKGDITSQASDGGVILFYGYRDINSNYHTSELTPIKVKSYWDRYSYTFTIPTGCSGYFAIRLGLKNATGSVYFDNIQLEKGDVTNPYNFISNSGFDRNLDSWTGVSLDSTDIVYNDTYNIKSFKFTGNTQQDKRIYQTINLSGQQGDTFKLSALVKANSVPTSNPPDTTKSIEINTKFVGVNGEEQWLKTNISPDSNGWQFVSDDLVAPADYQRIEVYLCYKYNLNDSYFDSIGFYKSATVTNYEYDDNNNITSTGNKTAGICRFGYDEKNQITTTTNLNNTTTQYDYDNNYQNRLTKITNANNLTSTFEYDNFGNITKTKLNATDNSKYIESGSSYSTDGRYQTQVIDQRGKILNINYNVNTGTVSSEINPKGVTTNYGYDTMDKLTSVNSGNVNNTYTYSYDNLLTQIDHNGFYYKFSYNVGFNRVAFGTVNTAQIFANTYASNNGNLTETRYQNGQKISYSYDNLKRLKTVTGTVGSINYKYDNLGNVAKVVDNVNQKQKNYYYDISNRLVNYKENNDFAINYSYDQSNNVNERKYNLFDHNDTIGYSYDNEEKLTNVNYGSSNIKYTYDNLSRPIEREIQVGINSYKTTYEYYDIDSNRTTTLIKSITNGTNRLEYTYDDLGNITSISKNGQVIANYGYDNNNQIISSTDNVLNSEYDYTYTYDNGGNITNKSYTDPLGVCYQNNYAYTNAWKDQVTSIDGNAVTYDEIGNIKTYNGLTYTWQNARELAGITNSDGSLQTQYKYNEDGIRISKTVNGITTKYYTEGDKIVAEEKNNGIIYYRYDSNNELLGFNYNGNEYYYVKNLQGDIAGILNNDLQQIVTYEYDAWGNTYIVDETISGNPDQVGQLNPFRYRSYYYDAETGLYYLNSRYYYPTWGRFLNADSILGANQDMLSYNLYSYVSNNPVNMVDPTGEIALVDDMLFLGGVLLVSYAAIKLAPVFIDGIQGIVANVSSISNVSTSESTNNDSSNNHNVYTLNKGLTIMYVGRTTHIEQTKIRHSNNPARAGLSFHLVGSDLTRAQARGLEQMLIMQCGTLNRSNPTNNQINGVAAGNFNYTIYLDAAKTWSSENIIPCR